MAELRATKRNPLLGLLADALSPVADYLSTSTNPLEDTGSDLSVTGLLGDTIRPVANTVNRMSYGEPLTTGRGMTTQMRPDTRDALLAVSPMGAGTKAAGRGVKAGAQALSPQAERMLMDTMRKMGGIKEITAYHGSPHTFDKFSLDKIGTGEGAQVYGHGLYFADNPEVAQQYQKTLAHNNYASLVKNAPNNYDVIAPDGSKIVENALLGKATKAKELFDNSQSGNLYKVDIPDEAVANMLLWDKPLSEQPEAVKRGLERIGIGSTKPVDQMSDDELLGALGAFENTLGKGEATGQKLYKELQSFQGSDRRASDYLKSVGIPGIRYLDQGSRDAGQGTMNTVLFDDALVKILERNGVPMQGLLD